MSFSDYLDQTVTIQSRGTAANAIGGISSVWSNRSTGTACAIWPASSGTVNNFGRADIKSMFEVGTAVYLQPSADDRAIINGQTYQVLGDMPYNNSYFSLSPVYVMVCGLRR
jgi:hypothetical protein